MCVDPETEKQIRDRFTTPCVKIRGSKLEFWSGVVGLSDKMVVFDGESPVAFASDLSPKRRRALAKGMIDRWQKFHDNAAVGET